MKVLIAYRSSVRTDSVVGGRPQINVRDTISSDTVDVDDDVKINKAFLDNCSKESAKHLQDVYDGTEIKIPNCTFTVIGVTVIAFSRLEE